MVAGRSEFILFCSDYTDDPFDIILLRGGTRSILSIYPPSPLSQLGSLHPRFLETNHHHQISQVPVNLEEKHLPTPP